MIPAMFLFVPRTACLFIGYFFGCFLTGALVVRLKTGKSASEFGTGNPGMANVMTIFGLKTGLIVLAGDLIKTVLACALCMFLFGGSYLKDPFLDIGRISCLWAGFGAVLGHNWPFWRKFSGGKGVAVTCMAIFLFSPVLGLVADLSGMMTVLTTGFLPLGAVVITMVFTLLCFLFETTEAAILALILMVIMFSRHYKGLILMIRGKEERYAQFLKPGRKKKPEFKEEMPEGGETQFEEDILGIQGMEPDFEKEVLRGPEKQLEEENLAVQRPGPVFEEAPRDPEEEV